jgi:two-component system NtrC family response regulator
MSDLSPGETRQAEDQPAAREVTVARVLIIDKDTPCVERLASSFRKNGVEVDCAADRTKGLRMAQLHSYSAVFLADNPPDGDVLATLSQLRHSEDAPEVVVLAESGDHDLAQEAIRAGAWNVFAKPPSQERLLVVVSRIEGFRNSRRSIAVALKRKEIIGNGPALLAALDQVAQAAGSEASVLVTGETGTGKELFARAVHENSRRCDKAFIVVDCAALPASLAESVLFGHERGAFTSADSRAVGLVKQAHGGTLFLDEVGELLPAVQRVFLRVLETRRFRPVGATQEESSDFRLVAATNRDLGKMAQNDGFRSDLHFRLLGIGIELPPLREITEDINQLACHQISRVCKRLSLPRKGFSPDFLDTLMNYDWPGNIRELFHALERAVFMAGSEPLLYPRHLPMHIRVQMVSAGMGMRRGRRTPRAGPAPAPMENLTPLRDARAKAVSDFERGYLRTLLLHTDGDIRDACRISGLSRARLYALMKERGINR